MKWLAKIGSWIIGVGILIYLVMALSFTKGQMDDQRITGISVEIKDRDMVDFLDTEEIIAELKSRNIRITNEPIDSINKAYIKDVVLDIPHVSDGEVFFTPDGLFHIKLRQRVPVMRIISSSQNYYVDRSGEVFPTSKRYTSRVPVFTGNIRVEDVRGGLLDLGIFLSDNEFWGAMIDQIQVWDEGNIELVPKVGNHKILLGKADRLDRKFEKLRAVYDEAFPVVGWDNYESVDLRFENQVVCKRKNKS